MGYRWIMRFVDEKISSELAQKINISEMTAKALFSRGLKTPSDVSIYLNPSILDLSNPFLLPDMDIAVKRIKEAIDRNEKILIYADRDVDGVTSVALLYSTLHNLASEPLWYVPSTEGYGLYTDVIEKYINQGVKLIITADCGTSSYDEVKYCCNKNVDIIITDHHEALSILPEAIAVINPKRDDNKYPFKDITGCTIALKLSQAIMFSYEPIYDKEMVVVDIETTGLEPKYGEICEIGAIKIKNFVPIETFNTLIKTEKPIPANMTRIHGITDEMVVTAPELKKALRDFIDFIGTRPLIIHNAGFDIAFIRYYAKKLFNYEITNPVIDTLNISRAQFPGQVHSLDALSIQFGLATCDLHRALPDARNVLEIYRRMEFLSNNRINFFIKNNLDIVSLSILADQVPLTDENRILVKQGFETIKSTRKPGVRAIANYFLQDDSMVTSKILSFNFIPLINSCGRVNQAARAVELLISENIYSAEKVLDDIIQLDAYRRKLQNSAMERIQQSISSECNLQQDKILFIMGKDIEHNIAGIIATRLVQLYNRPVIILTILDEEIIGTARAPKSVNILNIIHQFSHLLIKYGGHSQACGFTIKKSNYAKFHAGIIALADKILSLSDLVPELEIDAEIKLSDISKVSADELYLLEPYGHENPYLTFVVRNVRVEEVQLYGANNKHLKLKVTDGGKKFSLYGWHMSYLRDKIQSNDNTYDIVVQLELNRKSIDISLLDLRPSQITEEQ